LYGVVYFATQLECCFAETLSRLRPNPRLLQIAAEDQEENSNLMPVGEIPADWRHRRLAVCVELGGLYLDVEAMESRRVMEPELRVLLSAYGYEELDIPAIMSSDRRLTRWISWWAWSRQDEAGAPLFAGIRYISRLNTAWECWAAFADRANIGEIERRAISHEMAEFREILEYYGLAVL
jgi:hypothetical protein